MAEINTVATSKKSETPIVEQAKKDSSVTDGKAPAKQPDKSKVPPKTKEPEKKPNAEKSIVVDKSAKPEKQKNATRSPRPPASQKKPIDNETKRKPEEVNKTKVPEPETKQQPKDATRPGKTEQIIYIAHSELHPFKGHPFKIRDDDAMKSLMESVKSRGVDQLVLVRPRETGGYELVAGHRRQFASAKAGYENVPCIVRNMTDEEAVLAMTESNFNQRTEILPSERSVALKMQLEAIKRQGVRDKDKSGQRSNEIIAERNKMSSKTVQRYIALTNLVPEMMKFVDEKKIPFTPAVEMSYIKPKNQKFIALAIEAQESAPSLSQAQRMRELDQKGLLNGDIIDGIMLEEKKEEIRVILNSQELGKYFGAEKTPREMKDQILKLLDEWKEKQPPELSNQNKKQEQEL